ncbi:MAG TPA: hypothetical protein VHS78_18085 [Candidatus Elarobacter sp.]|jgi:hypothetical protein|nr:hypothetical protein [Candidatus Elarobacter sp.]
MWKRTVQAFAAVALAVAAVGVGSATRAADTAQAVQIRVVFLPLSGAPNDAVANAAQQGLSGLATTIDGANPLYLACAQTAGDANTACDAAQAGVLVSTVLRAGKDGAFTLVLNSFDVIGHRALGSVQKAIAAKSDGTPDDTVIATALKLSGTEIRTLIGTPVVRDGTLTLQAGSQPFIQLIPDVASNDPSYVALLQNLLAKRGIASVPSQFNAGTVTSGNVGADALCGLGQRYLVYSIAKRTEDRPLSFNTRVETRASGHLYDCPTRSDLAFGDTARTFATNTKQSLSTYLTLLGSLFVSKNKSWENAITTGGLVSTAFDVAPEKIQDHTAEITLQKFVDRFCERIKALPTPPPQATPPAPTATPSPSPTPRSSEALQLLLPPPPPPPPPANTPANASSGSNAAVPLDIGNFLSDAPPALACTDHPYEQPSPIPASAPLFNRRP